MVAVGASYRYLKLQYVMMEVVKILIPSSAVGIILGAMLANSAGIIGSGMHIAMHAFGKITLFFCAGAILVAAHKTKVSELDGIGRAQRVAGLGLRRALGRRRVEAVRPSGEPAVTPFAAAPRP